jgi:hypothetical protein
MTTPAWSPRRYAMRAPSGRLWALSDVDGAGNPTTLEDARRIAREFTWDLVEYVVDPETGSGSWVPVESDA